MGWMRFDIKTTTRIKARFIATCQSHPMSIIAQTNNTLRKAQGEIIRRRITLIRSRKEKNKHLWMIFPSTTRGNPKIPTKTKDSTKKIGFIKDNKREMEKITLHTVRTKISTLLSTMMLSTMTTIPITTTTMTINKIKILRRKIMSISPPIKVPIASMEITAATIKMFPGIMMMSTPHTTRMPTAARITATLFHPITSILPSMSSVTRSTTLIPPTTIQ